MNYLYPKEAWLIAELTQTMDYKHNLSKGLDVFTCNGVIPVTSIKQIRQSACRRFHKNHSKIPAFRRDDLNNSQYLYKMMMASFFLGLAFSNTRTTAPRSISYPLTMKYNVSHGYAVAVTLFEV